MNDLGSHATHVEHMIIAVITVEIGAIQYNNDYSSMIKDA